MCFCSRLEAACQNKRTGIYLRDLTCEMTPMFMIYPFFSIANSILEQSVRVCALHLYVCWLVCHRGTRVLFIWQHCQSEWDSKRLTCLSMLAWITPGIFNCPLCVQRVHGCTCDCFCVCAIVAGNADAMLPLPCVCCCHVPAVCWQMCWLCFVWTFSLCSNTLGRYGTN